jgi:hypothetical protein
MLSILPVTATIVGSLKPATPLRLVAPLLAAVALWYPEAALGQVGKEGQHTDVESRSRFRFAQTYLGVDLGYTPANGRTSFLSSAGLEEGAAIPGSLTPRLTVGGFHFWGRADFFVTFPLATIATLSSVADREISFRTGVETGARVYPWRLEAGRVRPFVGAGWALTHYGQGEGSQAGPELSLSRVPLQAGLIWYDRAGALELSARWTPGLRADYPLSRTVQARTTLPSLSVGVGYRYAFDATAPGESAVRSGEEGRREAVLAAAGRLNSFSVAVAPSSALPLTSSSYRRLSRPYLADRVPASTFPEFAVGYYRHDVDFALDVAFRSIGQNQYGFGVAQRQRRDVLSLELFKFVGDYQGFVPFVGATLGWNLLKLRETDGDLTEVDLSATRWAPGVVFGWDIRPVRTEWWLLRTKLRYTPRLELEVAPGQAVPFDHLEFNFIQFVAYPGRLMGRGNR